MEDKLNTAIVAAIKLDHKATKPPSIFITFLWAALFFIIPSLLVSVAFGFYAGASGIADTNAWFEKIETTMAMTFAIYFILAPMVIMVTRLTFPEHSIRSFFNLRQVSVADVVKITMVSAIFWGAMTLISTLLSLPEEPFMLQLKYADLPVWFVCLNVCLLAPIVEEIVFRGFLFKRIELTRLGTTGATMITSLLFASIHGQYQWVGLVLVFVMALYFSWLRISTQNTTLCIIGHALCNSFTMIGLYWFI